MASIWPRVEGVEYKKIKDVTELVKVVQNLNLDYRVKK